MEVLAREKGRLLTLMLAGELDHHGAKEAMHQIEQEVDASVPLKLTLDFGKVSFMDSSGIAVVLRTQRKMLALGGSISVCNIPPQAKKVFDAAGINRLVTMI